MSRLTVLRMLNKRLAESKQSLKTSHHYEDLVNVLGGDNSKDSQHRKNMETDIVQLEICIKALKDAEAKEV